VCAFGDDTHRAERGDRGEIRVAAQRLNSATSAALSFFPLAEVNVSLIFRLP
jgi:hypothetical protein